MNVGYIWTIKRLCFCLASFVILTVQTADPVHSIENNQQFVSQSALQENREKRNAEIELTQNDNLPTNKRYIPYEELQKRLRHFIGKRPADNFESSNDLSEQAQKRMRYFVGKRTSDDQNEHLDDVPDEDEIAKRMRYFVGKRSRLRYFVGKRDGDDKIEPSSEDNLEKRMRYFVGKRRYFIGKRRYFIGKRDNAEENDTFDPSDKRSRLRYFVGKRAPGENVNTDEFQKRMRYFVGKRIPNSEGNDFQKRMRYFVGKRDENSAPSEQSGQYEQKRMRYFVG